MTTSIERTSRKGNQPPLSDQLKASDLFPPGTGWNTNGPSPGVGADSRGEDSRKATDASTPQRQH